MSIFREFPLSPNLFSRTLSCYFQMPRSLWTLIITSSTPELALACLVSPSLCYTPDSASRQKARASVAFTLFVFLFSGITLLSCQLSHV